VKGRQQLWLRALDALQTQPMPGTDDARYPFWSPDSHYVGFFAQGELKKIAASGGPAQSLCKLRSGVADRGIAITLLCFLPVWVGELSAYPLPADSLSK
jgi:hypothetical protein